jgi:hypothetical protein
MSYIIFVEGVIRSGIWVVGAVVSYGARTRLSLAGCILAVVSSTLNALALAGAWHPTVNEARLLAAFGGIISALLVGAIIAHRSPGTKWSN